VHAFLSEEWVEAVRALRAEYAGALPEIPISIRVNQVITGVPFGDGTVRTFVDTSSGSLELELGELDSPDATMTTDYDTARQLFVGGEPALAMQALLAGKIVVQGDLMKLMALQTAIPASESSQQLAAEIAAVTA
jgi:hypothetical protein